MSLTSVISTIVLLTVVGAIIGGATNHIAIKMLFKPYHPIMIGKWRVPFTPGLIPKRHDEIAQELGRLVMKHLITPERLKSKLMEKGFSDQLSENVQLWVSDWLAADATVRDRLSPWVNPDQVVTAIEGKLTSWLDDRLEDFLVSYENVNLGDMLPEEWIARAENEFPAFARYIAMSLTQYLESDEGRDAVTSQLNQMFEGKGFFGNMLGLFLGNQSIVDKMYPELISFLNRPAFVGAIENLLKKEWDGWLSKSFGEVADKFDIKSTGKAWIKKEFLKQLPLSQGLDLKPRDLLKEWEEEIQRMVPKGVNVFLELLAEKVPEVLKSLDLEALVTEQVRQFSIQELEDVVLIISKKEFKMITYLGALLGGLIGIVQAIIVIGMG